MNESIPQLSIEFQSFEDTSDQILLEQDNCLENPDRITIHPIHLRYMAEKFGLVPTSDPQAQKTIEILQGRLITLSDRVDHLTRYLFEFSDGEHADLSYERAYSQATSDIAEQFCMDIVGPSEAFDDKEKQS